MTVQYLTVTALTKYIKRKFDTDPHLHQVFVRGEISNFKLHSRGHMYLTIKDNQTRIQAVMFAGNNRSLKFTPENGMKVLITGDIGVFEPYGQYQLYIQHMEPDGIGALYLAFEQLKDKLLKQGYFEQDHKKEIPPYPEHIGIVTSPTGAAIRDIITTIKRRYPTVGLTVIPALVQGVNAAGSIVRGIELANSLPDLDLLIVGRGGGSIEELWGFNEEIVAQAIYDSRIPIISAVGHETDTTISDYVSDLRAPTPTGAAELAVPSQIELKDKLLQIKRSLTTFMNNQLYSSSKQLGHLNQSYAFRYPKQLVIQKEQELDKLVERLNKAVQFTVKKKDDELSSNKKRLLSNHPEQQIQTMSKQIYQLQKELQNRMSLICDQKATQIGSIIDKLSLLNPLEIMKRGYAIPYDQNGNIIKSGEQASKNELIQVKLLNEILACRIEEIRKDEADE
ncbi:exodeoxyribonuclease VII large subunit [Virgibacillus phasianinus]|uniref:Exodeoxyribonuclease 7 large subunit n=1 Tax=Virgibacillus phasianinus TaxID=2017483 RepID=A0A220U573_9BACI|nr:exodeoxyribonuclease VII large subunit [Virgibacillus phasianinus]ASK63240.1 exodeoxyribonuclease VII large subunit [Virgibacillus phasianinus]